MLLSLIHISFDPPESGEETAVLTGFAPVSTMRSYPMEVVSYTRGREMCIRDSSNLLEKVDTLIIGGGMAYTLVKAQGYEVGKSLCDDTKQMCIRDSHSIAVGLVGHPAKAIHDAQKYRFLGHNVESPLI